MFTCCVCHREDVRGRIIFDATGSAEYCKHCIPKAHRDGGDRPVMNAFADGLTLQNVIDPVSRQPVTVNSLKELRQAEHNYGFVHAAMSDNDISKPPQHEAGAGNIARNYKRKWCRDESKYGGEELAKAARQTGVLKSAKESIVDMPNPINR